MNRKPTEKEIEEYKARQIERQKQRDLLDKLQQAQNIRACLIFGVKDVGFIIAGGKYSSDILDTLNRNSWFVS